MGDSHDLSQYQSVFPASFLLHLGLFIGYFRLLVLKNLAHFSYSSLMADLNQSVQCYSVSDFSWIYRASSAFRGTMSDY